MKPKTTALWIILFLLALSATLLGGFGPIALNCQKTVAGSADCRLTKSIALGFVDIQTILINGLTAAALDTRVEEILIEKVEIDVNGNSFTKKVPTEISVYGVRLMGRPSTLLNGYGRDTGPPKRNVEKINSFLTSDATQLTIKETPHGPQIFALAALGLTVFILFRD